MSQPISAYQQDQQGEVIARRLKNPTFGLGYWGAIGATKDAEVRRQALAKQRQANPQRFVVVKGVVRG
jgi:hypothetical protein